MATDVSKPPKGFVVDGPPQGFVIDEPKPKPPSRPLFTASGFGATPPPNAEQSAGALDAMATIGTGILSPLAGGIAAAPVFPSNPEAGAQIYENVSNKFQWTPKTELGRRLIGTIAPVAEAVDTGITDAFGNVPGGPVAQTIARTAVQAPLEAAGLRGVMRGPGATNSPVFRHTPELPTNRTIPEINDLFRAGNEAFTAARKLGSDLKPSAPQRLARAVGDMKESSGLRVIIDPDQHPKSFALRNRMIAETEGPMDFDQLLTLRQLAKDAAGGNDLPDARIAGKLRDALDEFMGSLTADDLVSGAPKTANALLEEGRALWRRARTAEEIERRMDIAALKGKAQFTGAGYEQALRSQFRSLAERIRNGKEPGFSPELARAVEKVANGDPVGNIFRELGKNAPTGIVSSGIGAGVGYTLFGPLGAAAVPAAGLLGRRLATAATNKNAQAALELARLGQ